MSLATGIIVSAANLTNGYAELLAGDIDAKQFGRFLVIDGKPVTANHPAWVYGHLAIYPQKAMAECGLDPAPAAVPESWQPLFANKTLPQDDPECTIYPAKDELVSAFLRGARAMAEQMPSVSEEKLLGPNPNEGMRERFPTLGDMVAFWLSGHPLIHLGQVSTWRRCMGLGPAM